ncbi:hypothetical protein FRC17_010518 [Serendipita sp. 399]|nr:hypothetical protein FRC17_010518 [Serendipita sp. 399]
MTFYEKAPVSTFLTPLTQINPDDHVRVWQAVSVLKDLQKELDARPTAPTPIPIHHKISARLLYSMMDYAPSLKARNHVAEQILSFNWSDPAEHSQQLVSFSTYIYFCLIQPLKLHQAMTPAPSNIPSHISSTQSRNEIARYLSPGKRFSVKAKALQRDNYRCLVTGDIDRSSIRDKKISLDDGANSLPTEAAHIIPFHLVDFKRNPSTPKAEKSTANLGQDPEQANSKIKRAAAFWDIVSWFGNIDLEGLNGPNINRLDNIIILSQSAHSYFDNLEMWLDEVPEFKNRYKVYLIPDYRLNTLKPEVQFTTSDADQLPVPNPAYLRLHAACAKIAYMSGIADIIHDLETKMEEMDVLAADGSSVDVLQYKLAAIAAAATAE